MVRKWLTRHGIGSLARIEGTLNSVNFCGILKDHLVNENLPPDSIFQQDNVPVHKSYSTMDFLQANNVSGLEWLAQSPDLNPIENLWHYISVRL